MRFNLTKLFVYGTLLENIENEFSSFLKDNSKFISKGFFYGRLYDLGEYPGAISDLNTKQKVYGNLYEIVNAEFVFNKLDFYEGFESNNDNCEFIRTEVEIFCSGKTSKSWIYLLNSNFPNQMQIKSGNYSEYLNSQKINKSAEIESYF